MMDLFDTEERRYIPKPKYAPEKIEKDRKTYVFDTAYINKDYGLEIVYTNYESPIIYVDDTGEERPSLRHTFISYGVEPTLLEHWGITNEDLLATEAENGYTEHLEAIELRLQYEIAMDEKEEAQIEEAKAKIKGLMEVAKKAKKGIDPYENNEGRSGR